jgi:hypothetical protein
MNWPAYCSGSCLSWAHSRAIPPARGRITRRNFRARLGDRDCVIRVPGKVTGLR